MGTGSQHKDTKGISDPLAPYHELHMDRDRSSQDTESFHSSIFGWPRAEEATPGVFDAETPDYKVWEYLLHEHGLDLRQHELDLLMNIART